MAFFKDTRCLEIISESSALREISSEGASLVLAETELIIRKLVRDCVKYSKKFRRTKIKVTDVKIALQNFNFDLVSGKAKRDDNRRKRRRGQNGLKRRMEHIKIGKEINEIIKHSLLRKKKMNMEISWFLIHGELNQQLVVKNKHLHSLKICQFGERENKTNIEQIAPELSKNVYQVKELTPNVLTRVN